MIFRTLPKNEWHRLPGDQTLLGLLPEHDIRVTVAEVDGEIVSHLFVMRVTHLEGLMIKPEFKGNPRLAMGIFEQAQKEAREFGTDWAWGASDTSLMSHIITRVGGKELPVKSYAIPIGGH